MDTINDNMCRMLKDMGLKNATLNLQAFVDNGTVRFYDPALRIGGGRAYLLTEQITGFNIQKALLKYAVTGRLISDDETIEISSDDWKIKGKYAIQPNIIVKTGTIGHIEGFENLFNIPEVISALKMHEEGDIISLAGTAQQTVIRMFLVAETLEDLVVAYYKAVKEVKITDDKGEDMLLPEFDFKTHAKIMLKKRYNDAVL